jgi:O-antigen/teichoic acid export membrane protein
VPAIVAQMQKKFVTNLAFLLFVNFLVKPFYILGIDRSIQNVVGAESFGWYYALFNFTFLFNIFLDFGITNFNNKNIAQNNHLLNKHFSGIVSLRILLAVVYGLIVFITGSILGYASSHPGMLMMLMFNQFLISTILYLRSNLSGLHMFKTDSIVSVLDRIILIAVCGVLLWSGLFDGNFRIEWFIYAQTGSYFLTAAIAVVMVARKATFVRFSWNPAFMLLIVRQSYPFALLILMMTFYNRIDTVMLERMLPNGAESAGIYAQAYRLLDAVNMMGYLFAVILLPLFATMIKRKDPVERLAKLAFSILLAPAVIIASISWFYRYPIMELLYVSHLNESSMVFGVVMSCFVSVSITYVFGSLLTANGSLKALNLMAFFGVTFNILLNFILIPDYGVLGAAWASAITQFITALIQMTIAFRLLKFGFGLRYLLNFLLYAGFVVLITAISMRIEIHWSVQIIICLAASAICAVGFKLWSIRNIAEIMRKEL